MYDWMEYMPTSSLERGCDYFEAGCVHDVRKEVGGWCVTVSGGSDYAVFIPTSMDPTAARCTCPHYADGNICKHIAAAFIAVECNLNASDAGCEDVETIEDIVMRVDEGDLRAFVVEAARNDSAFERELRAEFGYADVNLAKRELQRVTTDLMRRYDAASSIRAEYPRRSALFDEFRSAGFSV